MLFKIGTRVKVIKSPIFPIYKNLGTWRLSQGKEDSWGTVDLSHLVGEVGTIIGYTPNFLELNVPYNEKKCGWWQIKFDKNVDEPRGLQGFESEELEHLN